MTSRCTGAVVLVCLLLRTAAASVADELCFFPLSIAVESRTAWCSTSATWLCACPPQMPSVVSFGVSVLQLCALKHSNRDSNHHHQQPHVPLPVNVLSSCAPRAVVVSAESIKLDGAAWRSQMAASGGVAVLTPQRGVVTISSGVCRVLFAVQHAHRAGS